NPNSLKFASRKKVGDNYQHHNSENWDDPDYINDHRVSQRRSVLIAQKREADEHIVQKHFERLRQKCKLTNAQFQDNTFPANSYSLYINGHSLSETTIQLLPHQSHPHHVQTVVQWLRSDKILTHHRAENVRTQWTVFRDPKPNDVLQGALGDCWFITALSVLAEKPKYLKEVLITQEYNPEGIYYVRLCKDGMWTQVLVDDRFPCTKFHTLAYSQAQRKQLWVALIEKALAKLNGSYEAIIAGQCCEGQFNNSADKNANYNKLWEKLLHSRDSGFLMCAMCSNSSIDKEEFEKSGLLNTHAYSLQDVKEVNGHRLLRLRNPWGGTYRWLGDWSDDSSLWTQNPELRSELLREKRSKKDGVFWMPFLSFVKYFEYTDICKLREGWYEVRDSANFYPGTLTQNDQKQQQQQRSLSTSSLPEQSEPRQETSLSLLTATNKKFMQAYYLTIKNETELDITLYRKINKNLRTQRSEVSLCVAIVTIHSSLAIDLERVTFPIRLQREFLIRLCVIYGEKVNTNTRKKKFWKKKSDGIVIYELKKFWDGLVILVENRRQTKYVHFHLRCTLTQNAFISRQEKHELYDSIPPLHRQIVVTISRKNASHSFTIGHEYVNYKLSTDSQIKHLKNRRKYDHYPEISMDNDDDIHIP
ncbi:unnamed protein product, partial [Didymodactylos carnosus]